VLADRFADVGAQVNLAQSVGSQPIHDTLIERIRTKYSKVLGATVHERSFDYLLWYALEFMTTFAALKANAERLATSMLALDCVATLTMESHVWHRRLAKHPVLQWFAPAIADKVED
jgi:hypothetical protein